MFSGYYDQVYEYELGTDPAAIELANYDVAPVCQALATTMSSSVTNITPSHIYTQSELEMLNQD